MDINLRYSSVTAKFPARGVKFKLLLTSSYMLQLGKEIQVNKLKLASMCMDKGREEKEDINKIIMQTIDQAINILKNKIIMRRAAST